ncbi:MAG: ABC transporter permease [Thermoplasmata archaeon]|nr:ABC transporter permease [Thermoplasmata archaeon]
MNLKKVYVIGKKEFLDNLRNKWVIAMTVIFIVLALVASVFGGKGSIGGMEETVMVLLGIAAILVPIISIMLGYATISGEVENGSLSLLLSYPVTRTEVLLGKFAGLGTVIVVATVAGFGIAGAVIVAAAGTAKLGSYLLFIFLCVMLGLVYLSVSVFFSTLCSKRSTSLGLGILIFFWSSIYGTVILGAFLATGGDLMALATGQAEIPAWMWYSMFLSPADLTQTGVMLAFGMKSAFGYAMETPAYISLPAVVVAQVLWIAVPLILGVWRFRRRDI